MTYGSLPTLHWGTDLCRAVVVGGRQRLRAVQFSKRTKPAALCKTVRDWCAGRRFWHCVVLTGEENSEMRKTDNKAAKLGTHFAVPACRSTGRRLFLQPALAGLKRASTQINNSRLTICVVGLHGSNGRSAPPIKAGVRPERPHRRQSVRRSFGMKVSVDSSIFSRCFLRIQFRPLLRHFSLCRAGLTALKARGRTGALPKGHTFRRPSF